MDLQHGPPGSQVPRPRTAAPAGGLHLPMLGTDALQPKAGRLSAAHVSPTTAEATWCFANDVTLREIVEATKLPEEECKRQVMSLTVSRHKVLSHDQSGKDLPLDAKLQVNNSFSSEKIKVQVSLIKKEEKAAETTTLAEAPVERKHVIDAAIVRIMKSRNRLEHNALLEEVFRQCTLFKPQPTQIKSQIDP
eukprot:Skav220823  [mRNA]  locus=scaffold477:18323:20567:+ [translate_table: standard]